MLRRCLTSIVTCAPVSELHVSLSFDDRSQTTKDQILSSLCDFPQLSLHVQTTKMSQLQHLQFLEKNHEEKDDTWILFMDDDDLLLPCLRHEWSAVAASGQYNVLQGLQKIDIFARKDSLSYTGLDFSGYTASFPVVHAMFRHLDLETKVTDAMLADIAMMEFMDTQKCARPLQAIVHRPLWDNPQTWRQDLDSLIGTRT